jgi:gliding motility-associated-like protein
MNYRKIFTLALFALSTFLAPAQILINEVCGANYSDWQTGDYEDWIELFNASPVAVNIGGFHLSDNPDNPTKWEIPAGTNMPANSRLVVLCASELDNEMNGYLATNFRITQTNGETLLFADPGGTILDSYTITVPNQANHSWGRVTDGAADWKVFTNPTPGASNGTENAYTAYALRPQFSAQAGYVGGAFNLSLSTPEPGITIRYTTDGSYPTAASPVYSGPINITETTVVKAIAFSNNPQVLPSFIETNTYFLGSDTHTLPVVSVSSDEIDDLLNGGGWGLEPLTTFEMFNENGTFVYEVEGDANEHGNDSNAYDQRGFDYITRDQLGYDDEIEYPIFRDRDRTGFQRLIMKCAANDNYPFAGGAHIRDSYVHSLSIMGDMKLDERAYEPCILYVNGDYWGVYEFREKVDDLDFTDYYYDQPRHYVDFLKTWGGTWEEYGSGTDWYTLRDFIVGNDMAVQANYDYANSQFNTGSLIDYFILNSYTVCMDWLNWNTAWWRGTHPDGDARRWRYALWDSDATFGHYINYTGIPDTGPGADPCNPETLGDPGGQGHVPVLNALFASPEFNADYINRYADLSNSLFSCEFMVSHLDSMIALIEPEMPRQVQRWGGSLAGWETAVDDLRNYILERCSDELVEGMEDCYDVEAITVTIIIEGMGDVQINTITVTYLQSPWDGTYYIPIPIELEALTTYGGYFLNWEVTEGTLVLDDPTNPQIVISPDGDITIVAYFVEDLDPQMVMYDVIPAGAGDILVDGNVLGTYPTTVLTDVNTPISLNATPNTWFVFDHWESLNHTFDPDNLSLPTSITYMSTDTVYAVFTEIEHYNFTVDIEPSNAGTVSMEGVVFPGLPWTGELEGSIDIAFSTTPSDEWFVFNHWELNNNIINPGIDVTDIVLNLSANDTLVAVYDELSHYTVTVKVEPPYAGVVKVDDDFLVDYEWTGELQGDVPIAFSETPAQYQLFENWTSVNNPIFPSFTESDVNIVFTAPDTIVAYFIPDEYAFYIPNSFSPNGDGNNDFFLPLGNAFEVDQYSLQIFNRWGELVFETNNPLKPWDGSHNNGDYYIRDDVYVYRMRVKPANEISARDYMGHITVFR